MKVEAVSVPFMCVSQGLTLRKVSLIFAKWMNKLVNDMAVGWQSRACHLGWFDKEELQLAGAALARVQNCPSGSEKYPFK